MKIFFIVIFICAFYVWHAQETLTEEAPSYSIEEASGNSRIVLSEEGKHGPITFEVIIDADGRIKELGVLESREIRGAAIDKKRFLRQFKGKGSQDALKLNKDIHAVTGATISSEAAARAARGALEIWEGLKKARD